VTAGSSVLPSVTSINSMTSVVGFASLLQEKRRLKPTRLLIADIIDYCRYN
jgi:hypothetical protein